MNERADPGSFSSSVGLRIRRVQVQTSDELRVLLDELAAGLGPVAHQHPEQPASLEGAVCFAIENRQRHHTTELHGVLARPALGNTPSIQVVRGAERRSTLARPGAR